MKKRLFIVDDHPVMCRGLVQLLNQEPDLTVCGQAANAAQGLESVRALQPDLAIVDISLKSSNGLELVKDMHAFLPKLPVLVFSMHDELIYAERALRAGARGYIMKMEPVENILTAIRRLLGGQFYMSETMNARMVHRFAHGRSAPMTENEGLVESLSDRELQVLQHIGQGKGTREIANELHISVKTVETHRAHLKEKLQLTSAPALVRFAIQWARREELV